MFEEGALFYLENSPSKELMTEGYRAMIRHSRRAIVYCIAIAIGLALAVHSFLTARNPLNLELGITPSLLYSLYFLLLSGFLAWRLFTSPRKAAATYMKRLAVVYGDDTSALTVTYSFTEDHIHSASSNGAHSDMTYDQIVAAYETSHVIVLRFQQKLFETLDKSKIQGGSLQDFRAFIEKKATSAKVFWKR